MKTFVISLKRSTSRRKLMQKQLAREKVDFEFFDATDGLTITDEWIERNLSSDFKSDYKYYKDRFITKGALGCSDSHRRVWREIIRTAASESEKFLVLEDDCYIPRGGCNVIKNCASLLGVNNYEFILLYYTTRHKTNLDFAMSVSVVGGYSVYPYPSTPTASSLGYVITRNGAEKLLSSQNMVLTRMADSWDFEHIEMKAGLVYPMPIFTAGYPSTIVNNNWRTYCRWLLASSIILFSWTDKLLVPYLKKRLLKLFEIK
jgi:glycosyl transferase family 25